VLLGAGWPRKITFSLPAMQLAATAVDHVLGVHVSSDPGSVAAVSEHMPLPDLSASDRGRLDQLRATWEEQKGYLVLQSHRPQTMAAISVR
jgi:hypothetical protein